MYPSSPGPGMYMTPGFHQGGYGAYTSPCVGPGAGGGNSGELGFGPSSVRFEPPSALVRQESTAMEKRIEMDQDAIPTVVVVDDVLSTGKTLCAVLELLKKVGVEAEDVSVMVIAEFPRHGGRELLRKRGYGRARVQSLLIFRGD